MRNALSPAISEAEQRALVAAHYRHMTNPDLAELIGGTVKDVLRFNRVAKMKKTREVQKKLQVQLQRSRSIWQGAFLEVFVLMFPVMTNVEISDLMGVSRSAISQHAGKLGLRKDKRERPRKETKPITQRVLATAKKAAPVRGAPAPKERHTQAVAKAPPPMTPAMRARMEKERFHYPEGQLPWRAERMRGPVYIPTELHYRGQRV